MLIRSMENIHSNDCQCLLTGTSVIGEHLILRSSALSATGLGSMEQIG